MMEYPAGLKQELGSKPENTSKTSFKGQSSTSTLLRFRESDPENQNVYLKSTNSYKKIGQKASRM